MQIMEEQTVVTRDAVNLSVRSVQPDDQGLLKDFFGNVSEEDRRFRFLNAGARLGDRQLDPLVSVDHWQTENFLAFDTVNGALVASALLACDTAMKTGEVAVSVHKDYRGRGVGWAILDVLSHAAEERGLREVIAIEDRENHAAIELEREKGFEARSFEADPSLMLLVKSFA
jgi:GNAT superfamily N-acetyltransferase